MATSQKKSQKTKSSPKRKSTGRKKNNKVYVDPAKALGLCIVLMVICFALLFAVSRNTKIALPDAEKNPLLPSVSERFEEKKEDGKSEGKVIPVPNESKKEVIPVPIVRKNEENTKQEKKQEQVIPVPNESKKTVIPVPNSSKSYDFPKAVNNAQLIFVFDDGGQNLQHLDAFLNLPFPISVAVLPRLAHSKEAAAKIRKSGNELMLHQPMQAVNKAVNPGPGAITPEMNEDEIISTLFTNINEIGPIAGINNHEGSAITADTQKMEVILKTTSENGIFFLDSRTNVETKVPYVANALGYSWYERNIFLDNEKTKANALQELKKGLALANKNGSVIMIGHIWSADFLPAFLKEVYPELKEKGYTFSVVSKSKAKKY